MEIKAFAYFKRGIDAGKKFDKLLNPKFLQELNLSKVSADQKTQKNA